MTTHAQPQNEDLKKHGDVLEKAVKGSDEHASNPKDKPATSRSQATEKE